MLTTILASIIALWNICPKGETITLESPFVTDMIIVSDCDSQNMAPARNYSAGTLVDDMNRSTVFAQTFDGSRGVRIIFDRRGENLLHRGDTVKFNFNGCSIHRDELTDALTVRNLRPSSNILSCKSGGIVVPKVKTLPELRLSDINTFVKVIDLDVVFKNGSWYNIHEPYTIKMDGWASLLRSIDGRCIYMMLTNACDWRRTGKKLPQGAISVSGVIVHETNRRYGPDMGPFSIRPVFESDITVENAKTDWKTYCGWIKLEESGNNVTLEAVGTTEVPKKGVQDARIMNDIGSALAYLWTDSKSSMMIHHGYNSLSTENQGLVKNGAFLFYGKTVNWYEWEGDQVKGTKAFYLEVDTRKIKSGSAQFSFEWAAGTTDGNKSWYFPIDWVVECSMDFNDWTLLTDAATGSPVIRLHSVPWKDTVIEGSSHTKKMKAGYDTGMGEQQHSFIVPQDMLYASSVIYFRIRPAGTTVARVRSDVADSYASAEVNRNNSGFRTWIRFDNILFDCKK